MKINIGLNCQNRNLDKSERNDSMITKPVVKQIDKVHRRHSKWLNESSKLVEKYVPKYDHIDQELYDQGKQVWNNWRIAELLKAHNVSSGVDNTTAKFQRLYNGPFELPEQVCKTTYVVTDRGRNKSIGKFHASSLRIYYT